MAQASIVHFGDREIVRFNLMVIGESGLGKTTLLQSLLQKYAELGVGKLSMKNADKEAHHPKKTVAVCELGRFELQTDTGRVLFVLFDSPGYGDFINNQASFDIIHHDLLKRHEAWACTSGQLITEQERLMSDTRINGALYFISPHRMKDIDREFILQLHRLVPIIPIIAKADTMTVHERREYLLQVEQQILGLVDRAGRQVCYQFAETLLSDKSIIEHYSASPPGEETKEDDATTTEGHLVCSNLFAVVADLHSTRAYPWVHLSSSPSPLSFPSSHLVIAGHTIHRE